MRFQSRGRGDREVLDAGVLAEGARTPAGAEVRRGRVPLPARAQGTSHATLAPTQDGRTPSREALAALRFGEGVRFGFLGDTGTGKTTLARQLVAMYLQESPGVALVIDDKNPRPQYKGVYRRDRADLAAQPVDEKTDGRLIVLRGEPMRVGGGVDLESIAELQIMLAKRGRPSLGLYDELDEAATGGQWAAGRESSLAWCFGKGRGSGVSVGWGTQETEAVPRQAFNQSEVIFAFRMQGNPVRLLDRRGYLEGGADRILPRLAGPPAPPAKRGTYLILRRGQPWDRQIYKWPDA
jgi:energy-coupling factor transporter ATP-binding protein EcfA2